MIQPLLFLVGNMNNENNEDKEIVKVVMEELKDIAKLYKTTPETIINSRCRSRTKTMPLREFVVRMHMKHFVPIAKISKIVGRASSTLHHYVNNSGSAYTVPRTEVTEMEVELRKILTKKDREITELKRRIRSLTEKVKVLSK